MIGRSGMRKCADITQSDTWGWVGYLKAGSLPESVERLDAYYLRNPFWFGRLFRGTTNAYLGLRGMLRTVKKKAL